MPSDLAGILKKSRIIPIAVFDRTDDALKICELLLENGMNVLEITLRTKSALECIDAAVKRFPEMIVGAGSLLSMDSMRGAEDRGARFFVSPCLDPEILDYSFSRGLLYIPGTATPTEIHSALKKTGIIKIFPSSSLGGPEYIKAVAAPFRMMEFWVVPTGGINEKNYMEYLKIDRVAACGMSYPVEEKLVKDGDFKTLSERMKILSAG